ncbi:oxidoreductase [Methylopila sp. Yamaguchi]|uniref:oxidoreductase n=1 Tax=Methylopila sp. Yamaguchi TaxID=1437817 RepID=UPI000CCBE5B0|nr:oxidoreductase [Methylopila sp. Yamaguchi]
MKTWFITGAPRGFGALIAKEALDRGDNVVATARNPEAVTKALGERPNLLAISLDVNEEASAYGAVAVAIQRFGQIDVLVNNAGFGLLGAIEENNAREVKAVFRTNVFGLLSVTRAVLPHMRRERSGHVINISSIGGYRASIGWGVYCSTKFAVEGISEALAEEVAPLGIKVTVVEPGYFRTDFLEGQSLSTSPSIIDDYAETSGAMRTTAAAVSLKQPGDPTRLAKALMTLADAENPPLRMPFGSDTVAAIEAKNAFVAEELAAWRELAISTDFPKGK